MSGLRRPSAIRFTLQQHEADFRIDPLLVRIFLPDEARLALRRGAHIVATVSLRMLRSPSHPALNPELSIVWVYGLSIDGATLYSTQDVADVWRRDDRWGFALIGFSTLGCLYFGWKWWREGKADSTSG